MHRGKGLKQSFQSADWRNCFWWRPWTWTKLVISGNCASRSLSEWIAAINSQLREPRQNNCDWIFILNYNSQRTIFTFPANFPSHEIYVNWIWRERRLLMKWGSRSGGICRIDLQMTRLGFGLLLLAGSSLLSIRLVLLRVIIPQNPARKVATHNSSFEDKWRKK